VSPKDKEKVAHLLGTQGAEKEGQEKEKEREGQPSQCLSFYLCENAALFLAIRAPREVGGRRSQKAMIPWPLSGAADTGSSGYL
jgi:hypothetical protein